MFAVSPFGEFVCVTTLFYQKTANLSFFIIHFSICATYCTLSVASLRLLIYQISRLCQRRLDLTQKCRGEMTQNADLSTTDQPAPGCPPVVSA
jgi:hypothetical protein